MRHIAVVAIAVGVGALLVTGCGGEVSVDTKGGVAIGHRTLSVGEVPFTFEYPVAWREGTDASLAAANAVAIVGAEEKTYIAVRRNGSEPMSVDALERQARRGLGSAVVRVARETHASTRMVAITLAADAEGVHSVLYGFSGAGASWILECQSTSTRRAETAKACDRALSTLQWKR